MTLSTTAQTKTTMAHYKQALMSGKMDSAMAYLVYKVEPFVLLGTDTWIVQNGKIVYQTYAARWATDL